MRLYNDNAIADRLQTRRYSEYKIYGDGLINLFCRKNLSGYPDVYGIRHKFAVVF